MAKTYIINRLSILYPVSEHVQRNGDRTYTVITSGTYTTDGGFTPAGPIMIGGTLKTAGDAKTYGRGGVAVLADGKVVVARLEVNPNSQGRFTRKEIVEAIEAIASPSFTSAKVVDFMGGGAMVIENGKVTKIDDLLMLQKFNQGGNAYNSAQLRGSRPRVAIGSVGNRADLIIMGGDTKTAAESLVSSYTNLVVFDGGNGFWAHDRNGYHSPPTDVGANSTGFGVI